LDDETLDEIAESPRLWWNVRNRIETEKARRTPRWFAAFRAPIPVFGALAILVCLGLVVLFLNFSENSKSTVAEQKPVRNSTGEVSQTPADLPDAAPKVDSGKSEISKKPVSEKAPLRNIAPPAKFVAENRTRENSTKQILNPSKKEISPKQTVPETKTDFIALSYAANTESGQVVRVKVPSSMMVSLGVKTNVEKESELVNAEVVIGDDGLARAIRFIR